jgi:hypothetical protein
MKSRELQRAFWDWLSTAERLNRSLAEQQAALQLRDVARVESIQPELEMLSNRMREIDQTAAASTESLAEQLGTRANVRSIVEALNPAEARQVEALSRRVEVVASNLEERSMRNRKLIENELTYVGGTLALIAQAAQEQQGAFAPTTTVGPVLVDQVA